MQRLAKNYNIPKQFTPNVNKMKNFGALQFLVHKRYNEKSLSKYRWNGSWAGADRIMILESSYLDKDSWDEMVRDTVSETDQELQLELVCLCSNFNDQPEAAKWAHHYQLKLNDLPLLVQDYIIEQ